MTNTIELRKEGRRDNCKSLDEITSQLSEESSRLIERAEQINEEARKFMQEIDAKYPFQEKISAYKIIKGYLKDYLDLAINGFREADYKSRYTYWSNQDNLNYLLENICNNNSDEAEYYLINLKNKLSEVQEKSIELKSKLGIKSSKPREGFKETSKVDFLTEARYHLQAIFQITAK
ncbi:MAG: hypothetical protein WC781_04715 [Candidatus Pacearchaeota archaeon]|jgi:hypothetical protein